MIFWHAEYFTWHTHSAIDISIYAKRKIPTIHLKMKFWNFPIFPQRCEPKCSVAWRRSRASLWLLYFIPLNNCIWQVLKVISSRTWIPKGTAVLLRQRAMLSYAQAMPSHTTNETSLAAPTSGKREHFFSVWSISGSKSFTVV